MEAPAWVCLTWLHDIYCINDICVCYDYLWFVYICNCFQHSYCLRSFTSALQREYCYFVQFEASNDIQRHLMSFIPINPSTPCSTSTNTILPMASELCQHPYHDHAPYNAFSKKCWTKRVNEILNGTFRPFPRHGDDYGMLWKWPVVSEFDYLEALS